MGDDPHIVPADSSQASHRRTHRQIISVPKLPRLFQNCKRGLRLDFLTEHLDQHHDAVVVRSGNRAFQSRQSAGGDADLSITRRLLLKSAPSVIAASTTIAALATGDTATAQFTAIPTDVYEAIERWRDAHLRNVAAARDYSTSLRAKPIDKGVCGTCFAEMVHAEREVGPARQDMIFALLRMGGQDHG